MSNISVREMLEAGVHFGHQTHRWDPRMKPYIFGSKNGIHIINLERTFELCEEACRFVSQTVAEGGSVLFVGTKKQAQPIVEEQAKRAQMFYVSHRWLGGTLTNFRTIQASINRLKDLEKKLTEGGLGGLTKREKLGVERDIEKLTKALGGIKEMNQLPSIIFLIDPHREKIAKMEAERLHIPIVAVADTNCNPEGIDYLVPGNDDAIKAIRLLATRLADACLEGIARRDAVTRERRERSERPVEGSVVRDVGGGKGKAYVSKPEAFEGETAGEYADKSRPNEDV